MLHIDWKDSPGSDGESGFAPEYRQELEMACQEISDTLQQAGFKNLGFRIISYRRTDGAHVPCLSVLYERPNGGERLSYATGFPPGPEPKQPPSKRQIVSHICAAVALAAQS